MHQPLTHPLIQPAENKQRGWIPYSTGHICLRSAPLLPCCRSHLILRNLRPPGSKEYVIPKGFAFNYITCANYTFEIYGWILFGVATQTVAAFMFITAGSLPMTQWAIAKHKRLRKVSCGAFSLLALLMGAGSAKHVVHFKAVKSLTCIGVQAVTLPVVVCVCVCVLDNCLQLLYHSGCYLS